MARAELDPQGTDDQAAVERPENTLRRYTGGDMQPTHPASSLLISGKTKQKKFC